MSGSSSGSASSPGAGTGSKGPVQFTAGVSDGAGGLIGGAHFRVDRDQIPRLLGAFETAHDMLDDIDRRARQLGSDHTPPANEPYSRKAASEISRRASDDHGCHGQANKAYRDMVQNVIDNLRQTFTAYAAADDGSMNNLGE